MTSRYRRQSEALQFVDRLVHALVRQLRGTGRLRDTLIIFTTDQGALYGEHRWTYKDVPYEESIRTLMIVRYDARISSARRGSVSDAMIGNIDIAPTIAEVSGLSETSDGVGRVDDHSMVPLLTGAASWIRRALLLEHVEGAGRLHRVPSFACPRNAASVPPEPSTSGTNPR